ncbi:MAG: hypothetical protein M2R45_02016 [Verrucomicrobia subdivision 3 bacterium]|nr:hypothetical protein [Limisphaerales bacterium]MCS1414835.1 hypothetical protein [Limisphaerales bacterium]
MLLKFYTPSFNGRVEFAHQLIRTTSKYQTVMQNAEHDSYSVMLPKERIIIRPKRFLRFKDSVHI